MNYNPKTIIAFVLILFVVLIFGGALLAQDRSKPLDPKAERMNLSVPEIFMPPVNVLSVLQTVNIDTTQLKVEIEQITAKRKELAEFERHYKAMLKLKRTGK